MGIELYIIKVKNDAIDIFSQDNHEILDIIGMNTIYNCHPEITTYLLRSASIENKNDKSAYKTYMCKSTDFVSVIEFIDAYIDKLKHELDEQYDTYKKSQVLEFLKENSHEKIENLLKNRLFEEYKDLMNKFIDIINKDLDDNYDTYEFDSYQYNDNMYNRIKNISDKLKQYMNQIDIYYYLSY